MKLFAMFVLGAVSMAALYILVVCVLSLEPRAPRAVKTADQPAPCMQGAWRAQRVGLPVCPVRT